MPRIRREKPPLGASTQTVDDLDRNIRDSQAQELPKQGGTFRHESSRHRRRAHNLPDLKAEPLGYSKSKKFYELYPELHLPALHPAGDLGTISFGSSKLAPNALYLGDNLQVLRSLPTESVDLIYIDPPFFSGRNYNLIWGDDNELRTFGDIWEDGLPSYLEWLNARLWEMARVLKKSGSIYVHCDWHASHYIKTEMDKIFGYENFLNEIIWGQDAGQRVKDYFPRKHDVVLSYCKNPAAGWTFNWWAKEVRAQYNDIAVKMHFKNADEFGPYREYSNGKKFYQQLGKMLADVWTDISSQEASSPIMGEKIGYPTQKPESLLQRIISVASDSIDTKAFKMGLELFVDHETQKTPNFQGLKAAQRDAIIHNLTNLYLLREHKTWASKVKKTNVSPDIVADFFMGGGTTLAVAQKLGRQFVGCDVSNVAFDVTRSRLIRDGEEISGVQANQRNEAVQEKLLRAAVPDVRLKYVGIYPTHLFDNLDAAIFRRHILTIVRARESGTDDGISGYAAPNEPILVGSPDFKHPIDNEYLRTFLHAVATKYKPTARVRARVFAWHFPSGVERYAKQLRQAIDEMVRPAPIDLELIPIESEQFRHHVVSLYSDVEDAELLLAFVRAPVIGQIEVAPLGDRKWRFEAKGARSWNPGVRLVNCQWDFDYQEGHFNADRGAILMRDKKTFLAVLVIEHEFVKPGRVLVACKLQDSAGGECLETVEVRIE